MSADVVAVPADVVRTEVPVRVSTVSAAFNLLPDIAGLRRHFDVSKTFDRLELDSTVVYKRYHDAEAGVAPNGRSSKQFSNSIMFVYVHVHVHAACAANVSVKVFESGGVQMAGLKDAEHGLPVAEDIVRRIRPTTSQVVGVNGYKVIMINSDFDLGFPVNREALFRRVLESGLRTVSFEPCVYPAVKLRWYYNGAADGVCRCEPRCRRSDGLDGRCKKVTVSVFRTGKVVVMGSNSMDQVRRARDYVVDIVGSTAFHPVH